MTTPLSGGVRIGKASSHKPMMDEPEESDLFVLATKRTNKRGRPRAESVERRERAEGNTSEQRTHRTLSRERVSQRLERVRERARHGKKERFTALMHHITLDVLDAAFGWLKRNAAAGADDVTWHDYAQHREANVVDLHQRLHRGAYRAMPSRRKFIPKPDGRQRPLGIAALEDKIVRPPGSVRGVRREAHSYRDAGEARGEADPVRPVGASAEQQAQAQN